MEFAFPWPVTEGEWFAFVSAAVTTLFGAILLFAPGLSFRLFRLQTRPDHPEAYAAARANMAGFYLGLGLSSLLLAQPLLYMALGFSWLFTAFGRIVSMMSDQETSFSTGSGWSSTSRFPASALAFALGFVP